jgi:hypothetical protein
MPITEGRRSVWFKHRAWIPLAWIFSAVNLGAVWFAARPGEAWHASTHALLAVAFAIGAQRLQLRRRSTSAPDGDMAARVMALEARLINPEQQQFSQALDAIALEVERIGESQRYLTKVIVERGTNSP